MIVNYEGQDYPFDMDDVDIQQALAIEKFMGCNFDEWGKKLMAGIQAGGTVDLRARQTLGWLVLHGAGTDGKDLPTLVKEIGDTNFKMMKFGQALDAAYEAEAGPPEPEPGPTAAAAASNGRRERVAAESSPASSPPSSDVTSP